MHYYTIHSLLPVNFPFLQTDFGGTHNYDSSDTHVVLETGFAGSSKSLAGHGYVKVSVTVYSISSVNLVFYNYS